MSERVLERILQKIEPVNVDAQVQAQARLDVLTKPPGSLGRLEDLAVQYVAITGNVSPPPLNSIVFTLAADHGVTAEGVSAYPQSVTAQMVKNFVKDGAGVNVLARHAGASSRPNLLGVLVGSKTWPCSMLRSQAMFLHHLSIP